MIQARVITHDIDGNYNTRENIELFESKINSELDRLQRRGDKIRHLQYWQSGLLLRKFFCAIEYDTFKQS